MAWNNVLCVYYSRTGNTRTAMEEIAKALGAELVELEDSVDRSGWGGWLRCGLDAMRRTVPAVKCPAQFPLTEFFKAQWEEYPQRLLRADPGQRGQERGNL